MTVIKLDLIVLQLSIVLVVFSLGLQASVADAISLFHRPSLLFRSLLSMNIVMPVFAAFMAATLHLNPAVKIALVMLAVSPVPPLLPRQQLKLGGRSNYVSGLLVSAALFSIVLVPLTIEVLAKVFSQDVYMGPLAVAKIVGKAVLLPLAAGILLHHLAPALAGKIAQPLSRISILLLLAASLIPLVVFAPSMADLLGNGTLLSIVIFVMVGVAVGHLLGGPDLSERSTLALATASRHPGLALAIASANYPGQRRNVAAVVLLYLIVKAIVLIPYNAWRKRQMQSYSHDGLEPKQRAA